MLFDPLIVVREPLAVLAVLLVIVVGKSLAAFLIVLAFRYPAHTALTVSASLAQIGEFSFILAGLGMSLGLLSEEARDLILAGALLSIALNPLAFACIPVLERLLRVHAPSPRTGFPRMSGHAVVVGHGRVGGAVTPLLAREGLAYVVIERDRALVEPLTARNIPAICGDATMPGVLEAASIENARLLIVAQPDGFQARRILELARELNPRIDTVVRTHSETEVAHLTDSGVGLVVMGELELARRMSEYALRSFGVPPARAALLATGQDEQTLAEKAEGM
jgi:CPA2 family monovalent cation:H+ antiporter-2